MKKFINEIIPYIVIITVVVLIRTFIITPVIVVGDSMNPTLKDNDILLLNKINYRLNDIKRFDIVVIDLGVKRDDIIKRIIGLPGEKIEYRDSKLYINDKVYENDYNFKTDDFTLNSICNCYEIPKDKYLVLGDNRGNSADSRIYGLIDKKNIIGNVNFRLWPLKQFN